MQRLLSSTFPLQRPVLPESRSTETPEEMFARYKTQLHRISCDITEHDQAKDEMFAEGPDGAEYWQSKRDYLVFERDRITAYLAVLKSMLILQLEDDA